MKESDIESVLKDAERIRVSRRFHFDEVEQPVDVMLGSDFEGMLHTKILRVIYARNHKYKIDNLYDILNYTAFYLARLKAAEEEWKSKERNEKRRLKRKLKEKGGEIMPKEEKGKVKEPAKKVAKPTKQPGKPAGKGGKGGKK